MPTVFYTTEEFAAAVAETTRLKEQLECERRLRPVWALGYSSDSVAACSMANALSQLWQMLGAANQTEAVALLQQLKA